jgi:Flagellar assembly protein T, N-terminal domain
MGALMKRLWVVAVLAAPAVFAQDVVTVEATGEAAIVGNDEAKALGDATQAALRAAVEQVAGVSIEGQTQTLNNVLLRDQVVARTSGYVKKHSVVSKKAEKGVLTVKVKAEVGKGELSKDVEAARALVKRFGRPSIVIVLQEQTAAADESGKITGTTSTEVAPTALTEAFRVDGWDIKDEKAITGALNLPPGTQIGDGHLKQIADLSKAAYVLYGRVNLRNLKPIKGSAFYKNGEQIYFPVSGEYDMALAATDTGSQITKLTGKLELQNTANGKKDVVGASTSYDRTGHDLVKRRAAEIVAPVRAAALENFRNRELNGNEVIVAANGLGNYAGAQDFKKAVEALPGVQEVEHLEFKGGTGSFRVTFKGSTSEFAEAMGKATFKKKKVEVNEVTGNKVVLAVAK